MLHLLVQSVGWWAVDRCNHFQLLLVLVLGPTVMDVSQFELYGRSDGRAAYVFSSRTHPLLPQPRLLQKRHLQRYRSMLSYSQNLQESKKSKFVNWRLLNELFCLLVRAGSNRRLKSWSSSWDQSACYSKTNHGDSHMFFSNCHKLNCCLYLFIQNY